MDGKKVSKIIYFFAVITLIFVVSCSKEIPKKTETDNVSNYPCPECEKCPLISDVSPNDKLSLSINDITAYGTNIAGKEERTVLQILPEDLDIVSNLKLSFRPECQKLTYPILIKIDDKTLYQGTPDCNTDEKFSLDIKDLKSGYNFFSFYTVPSQILDITHIKLYYGVNGEEKTKEIGDILFKKSSALDEKEIETLGDLKLSNYAKYTIDLSSTETLTDLTLKTGTISLGVTLSIFVNDNLVYKGEPKKEYIVDKKYLVKGDNEVIFLIS
ncbi:MAG: hypothetical protein V1859_07615 [archaeon]